MNRNLNLLTEARFDLMKRNYEPRPPSQMRQCLCCLAYFYAPSKHVCYTASKPENQS